MHLHIVQYTLYNKLINLQALKLELKLLSACIDRLVLHLLMSEDGCDDKSWYENQFTEQIARACLNINPHLLMWWFGSLV